jgi:hypothetical protein
MRIYATLPMGVARQKKPLAVSHQSCSLKTDIAENPSEPELNWSWSMISMNQVAGEIGFLPPGTAEAIAPEERAVSMWCPVSSNIAMGHTRTL